MRQINEDIKSGNLKQAYLLFGEEEYLVRQYRDKLFDALRDGDEMNVHRFEGKEINMEEVLELAETLPFLASRRVILLQDTGWFKHGGENMAAYLAHPAPTAFFLFAEHEVDKRSRLYKQAQSLGYVKEFAAQDENSLKRWIGGILKKEGLQIKESTVEFFLERVGTDMGNIRLELEKLICYCMGRDVVERQDVEAVCTASINNRIFDMVEAIGEKRTQDALALYYDLLALKEPPLRILALIGRQCNILLQVKQLKGKGQSNQGISEAVKVPLFAVRKYAAQAARFKERELRNAVVRCVEAEEAVKTGRMDKDISVETLILSVL